MRIRSKTKRARRDQLGSSTRDAGLVVDLDAHARSPRFSRATECSTRSRCASSQYARRRRRCRPTSRCRTTSCASSRRSRRPRRPSRMSSTIRRPDVVPTGQVDLGDVAGDHDLGAEAEAGEEHLHLLGRGVLRLVEDDERVVERAAAHVGQRGDLDGAGGHQPAGSTRGRSCRAARRRAGAGRGRSSRCSVPGRKPSRSPASTAGRVRMIRLTCLACSAWTALAMAR